MGGGTDGGGAVEDNRYANKRGEACSQGRQADDSFDLGGDG